MQKSGKVSDPKKKENRYVLFTGAPGSRWSGVANNLTLCRDFDTSDQNSDRSYHHNDTQLHGGAYFDPEMEFEFTPHNWDKPFSGEGVRLIKSHTMALDLDPYKNFPIVMVYRNDYECMQWWKEAGGFDIKYPNYSWYHSLGKMWIQIQRQNKGIMNFIYKNRKNVVRCIDSFDVLKTLGLNPTGVKIEHYAERDVTVYVYKPTP